MVVLLTTSRDASIRLRQFINELELAIPGAIKVNRGRSSLTSLATLALSLGAGYIVLFKTFHGNPSSMDIYKVKVDSLVKLPYVISLSGVKLLSDMLISRPILGKPSSMVIVSKPNIQLSLVLSEVFNVQLFYGDISDYRGFECIMYVRPIKDGCCEVSFIDGLTYAPRGPIIRVKGFREVKAPGLVVKRFRGHLTNG
ncbi:MAG: hypothetical protein RXQ94_06865 [Caldivirga sp.]|jgi:U3 small nucleolar ribonucleoprotein protein IMP4